jgi:hypothetical protein
MGRHMLKRIKQFLESVAYAGLRPRGGESVAKTPSQAPKGISSIRAWVETQLNRSASTDPLYLSNRTLSQKLKFWAMVGIPCALALTGVALVFLGVFEPNSTIAPPPVGPSNAEIEARMLPGLNAHVENQHELEVQDVHVVTGSPFRLAGTAKNNTDHLIARAELVFDLTDKNGSRQGAVSTELTNIASKTSLPFEFPIEQTMAKFAMVREVRIQ